MMMIVMTKMMIMMMMMMMMSSFRLVRSKRGVTDLNDMVKSRMDILMPDDSDTAADNPEDDVKVCVLERNVRYMLNRLKHVEVCTSAPLLTRSL